MAERGNGSVSPRRIITTPEFRRWLSRLDPERAAKVRGTLALIADGGPTRGRPHADVIHGSRVRKLKEARIDRSMRALFAFDSNRNLVALVGGDKAGKWDRWYPQKIRQAEGLYLDHERSIGKEARWTTQRPVARTSDRGSR